MAKMTEARRNAVAFEVLVARIEKEGGIQIGPGLRRELGEVSKKTGIEVEELEDLSKELLTRMIGRAYGMQSVSLTLSDPVKKS